jgi:methyl-accepting chemotaxis protein
MDINIGDIVGRLRLDTGDFGRAIADATRQLQALGQQLAQALTAQQATAQATGQTATATTAMAQAVQQATATMSANTDPQEGTCDGRH